MPIVIIGHVESILRLVDFQPPAQEIKLREIAEFYALMNMADYSDFIFDLSSPQDAVRVSAAAELIAVCRAGLQFYRSVMVDAAGQAEVVSRPRIRAPTSSVKGEGKKFFY